MRLQPKRTASYTVRETRNATRKKWDDWLGNSPGGGHALQSHAWGEFKRGQGWRPLRLVLEKDGEVAGAGQFLLYDTFPVPGCLMYCTKGPWLPWDDEGAVRAFFDGVTGTAAREGAHTVKIEPEVYEEREEVRALLGELGFSEARYDLNFDTTIIMDLGPSEKELLDEMSGKDKKGKNTRYNINLANRKGVEVVEMGNSPEEFEWAFETLYGWIQDLAEHKDGFTNKRPREYFHDMMRRMHDAGQGHFFFALHEGQPLSGSFVFTFEEKLWFMHGASDQELPDEKRKVQGNHLLQWKIMRWAKQRGINYADFVGAPRREERTKDNLYYGSYEFKRGFGGEVVEFVGCLDLPVAPRRAAAWYALEPLYYRAYYKARCQGSCHQGQPGTF